MRALILAIAGLLVALPASAATYYVSNEASHGYVVGSDSNGCTAVGTPCLTIAHAVTLVAANGSDSIVVNPSATPYVENSGSSYLDMGTTGTITGDTSLCGTGTGPTLSPTIQSTAASRVIDTPTRAFTQTLACLTIDAQASASRAAVQQHSNPNLVIQQVAFKNVAAGAALTASPTAGGSGLTLDRVTMDSTNASTAPWGSWGSASNTVFVLVKGGTFNRASASNAQFYFSGGTFTSIKFQADVNGVLPTFTASGTPSTYQIRVTGATVTTFAAAVDCESTSACIQLDSSTLTNWAITGSTFNNIGSGDAAVRMTNDTCTTGALTNNTGNGLKGMIVAVAESCNGFVSSGNAWTMLAGSSGSGYSWIFGTSQTSQNDTCTAADNTGATVCFIGATNGWSPASTNTGTSTGSQKLGDISGDTYVSQSFTTAAANSSGRFTHLAAFQVYLSKTGTPSGNVTMALYADNAGSPGTLVANSDTTVAASSLTGSVAQYQFAFNTPSAITAATVYHMVITYSGSISSSNYVVLDKNSTVTTGNIHTSTDASTWTNVAGSALRSIIYGGYYSHTATYSSTTCTFIASDTRELECVTSGPNNGTTIKYSNSNNGYTLWKNTLGTSTGYGNLLTGSSVNVGGNGYYSKASKGVRLVNNTCVLTGVATGVCVQIADDSLGAVNPQESDTPTVKNNIFITSGAPAAAPYSLNTLTTGSITIDYNDVVSANNASKAVVTSSTAMAFAGWQTAGYDVHGTTSDPSMSTAVPTTFAQAALSRTSAVASAGTDTRSIAAVDPLGNPYLPTATMGAVSLADGIPRVRVASGTNVYYLLRNSAGSVWNGTAFEPYAAARLSYYAQGMTQSSSASQTWSGSMPFSGLAYGAYNLDYRLQVGGSPAETDTIIADPMGVYSVGWTGRTLFPAIFYPPIPGN